jgi:hypothetical protein
VSAERIPCDAEFLFVETVRTGTVHIAVKYMPWHDLGEQVGDTVSGGASFIALALAPTITRCGKRTHPGNPSPAAPWRGTDCFSDDQLCAACYRTLHPDDHERAFEHKQPRDTA